MWKKIVASKDGFEWYLRFGGDPNDPIKCKVNGKRRQTATYTIGEKEFPTTPKGNTGSYKGQQEIISHRSLISYADKKIYRNARTPIERSTGCIAEKT